MHVPETINLSITEISPTRDTDSVLNFISKNRAYTAEELPLRHMYPFRLKLQFMIRIKIQMDLEMEQKITTRFYKQLPLRYPIRDRRKK